jgi:hypothetical protein
MIIRDGPVIRKPLRQRMTTLSYSFNNSTMVGRLFVTFDMNVTPLEAAPNS